MADTTCHMSISLDGFAAGRIKAAKTRSASGAASFTAGTLATSARTRRTPLPSAVCCAPAAPTSWAATCLADPRRVGRGVVGLVGARAALPRARVRPHPSHSRADRDGGRDDFHFVTEGFDAAYAQAREAAGADGIDIAGGASTVRQICCRF